MTLIIYLLFLLKKNYIFFISLKYLTCPIQLTQWRQFEEDQNNPSQMAKYFSSPSKSQPSVYSQDEIFYLLGENSSMKKLLNEVTLLFSSQN